MNIILEWTTDPPKSEGVYWAYRKENGVEIAEVIIAYEYGIDLGVEPKQVGFECLTIYDDFRRDLNYYTHWMGPLIEPAPPEVNV